MARRSFLALLVACALVLSGCGTARQLTDRTIVLGIGFNAVPGGGVKISTLAANTSHSGGGGGGGGGGGANNQVKPFVIAAQAQDVGIAANNLQRETPRRLFWSQSESTIIGEQIARQGILPLLDYMASQREIRLSQFLMLDKDPAHILATRMNAPDSMSARAIQRASTIGISIPVHAFQAFVRLHVEGRDLALPVVSTSTDQSGQPQIKFGDTGWFVGDKLVKIVNKQQTEGLQLIDGWARGLPLAAPVKGGKVVLVVRGAQTSIKPTHLPDGSLALSIRMRLHADIEQNQSSLDLHSQKATQQVSVSGSRQAKQLAQAAIKEARTLGSDVFGFGASLQNYDPGDWQRLKTNWRSQGFKNMPVQLHVQTVISSTGAVARQ